MSTFLTGNPDARQSSKNELPVSYHVSGPPRCSFQLRLSSKKQIPLSEHIPELIQHRNGSNLGLRLFLSPPPSFILPTKRHLLSNKSDISFLTSMSLSIRTNPCGKKRKRKSMVFECLALAHLFGDGSLFG